MSLQGKEKLACGHIPELHHPTDEILFSMPGETFSVGAEHHTVGSVEISSSKGADFPGREHIPQLHVEPNLEGLGVDCCDTAGEPIAVGADGHKSSLVIVSRKDVQIPARKHIPDLYHTVPPGAGLGVGHHDIAGQAFAIGAVD